MTFEEELVNPENEYVAVIGRYLKDRALTDQSVAKNLKKENKSLNRCFKFIIDEARKMQKGNCAMIRDDVVFGWAVHYYDEDNLSIDAVQNKQAKVKKAAPVEADKKKVVEVKQKPKTKKAQATTGEQLSLF